MTWHAEPYFRARTAADFAPEEWLSALRPKPQSGERRWFRLYSQLHVKVMRQLPALEKAYSQLSRAVRRDGRHVEEHEILQKWRVMRTEKTRREQEVQAAQAQHALLEANLEHWELRKDEQLQVMKRKHQEMRREAQERIIANEDHCRTRLGWETIYLRRDANLHAAVDELLRRALQSGIRVRGFAASVGRLDALGMLKVVLCAMLGELVGEHKGSRDDATPHQATQWPIRSPLVWVREAGADAKELAAVTVQSMWRGKSGRTIAQRRRVQISAAGSWGKFCRALRSHRMQKIAAAATSARTQPAPALAVSEIRKESAAPAALTVAVQMMSSEKPEEESETTPPPTPPSASSSPRIAQFKTSKKALEWLE